MPNIAPPHFKTIVAQQRNNNYTLFRILSEFIDNVIKKCENIKITTISKQGDEEKLHKIQIADSYEYGFENILEEDIKNPFNMGHLRTGQDDDDEISEYGMGLKSGAIACADFLEVYSKVKNKYYRLRFDFEDMCNTSDVNKSYQYKDFEEINETQYKDNHCYHQGSSIILTSIQDKIYKDTNYKNLNEDIYKHISKTYANIIRSNNINIYIESKVAGKDTITQIVKPYMSFFDDRNCRPFTKSYKLYYLKITKNKSNMIKLICSNDNKIYYECVYDEKIKKDKLEKCDDINKLLSEGYTTHYHINSQNKWCIEIDTTFVLFSLQTENEELPKASTEIYKDGRLYGIIDNLSKSQDGYKNHVLHRVNFKSKKIGKELGITFNKYITFSQDNNLIKLIRTIIWHNQMPFTNKRTEKKYKDLFDKAKKAGLEKVNDPKLKPQDKKQIIDDDLISYCGDNEITEDTKNKTSDNKLPDNKLPDNKLPDNKLSDNKLSENKISDNKLPDNKLSENKTSDNKLPDSKLPENKLPENKLPENKLPENKLPENKLPENKTSDNRLSNIKTSNTKLIDTKSDDTNSSEKKTPGIIKSKFNKKEESKYEVSKGINQYFYLIQTKENIGTNIYKIGKTEQYNPNDRLKEYVSGYVIHLIIKVKNASYFEENIIIRFKEIFEQSKREYFEGDINIMNDIIAKLWINECN